MLHGMVTLDMLHYGVIRQEHRGAEGSERFGSKANAVTVGAIIATQIRSIQRLILSMDGAAIADSAILVSAIATAVTAHADKRLEKAGLHFNQPCAPCDLGRLPISP